MKEQDTQVCINSFLLFAICFFSGLIVGSILTYYLHKKTKDHDDNFSALDNSANELRYSNHPNNLIQNSIFFISMNDMRQNDNIPFNDHSDSLNNDDTFL
tara:strand:+ start:36 stop:335 length:300 start_codon:yes stop_codon:yes gene_type:complete